MIENRQVYKLGLTQHDFYITEKNYPDEIIDGLVYIMGSCYFCNAPDFDSRAMSLAYRDILKLNESFRMRLIEKNGRAGQYFREAEEFPEPSIIDYNGTLAELKTYFKNPSYKKITMRDPFLTMGEIYKCSDGKGALILWQHHICTDGYSAGIIVYDQLCKLYSSHKNGEIPDKPKKEYLFSDYLKYEEKKNSQKRFKSFVWTWKDTTHHFWKYRVPIKPPEGIKQNVRRHVNLGRSLSDSIDDYCKKNNCSDTVFFMCAAAMFVNRVFNAKRFLFTTESHFRAVFTHKKTCGPIVNAINVYYDIDEEMLIADFLKKYSKKLMEASMHLKFSYVESVCCFSPLNYIFSGCGVDGDGWFRFNNQRAYQASEDLPLEYMDMVEQGAADSLALDILEDKDGIILNFQYEPRVMNSKTAEKTIDIYIKLLGYMLENPTVSVKECIENINWDSGKH